MSELKLTLLLTTAGVLAAIFTLLFFIIKIHRASRRQTRMHPQDRYAAQLHRDRVQYVGYLQDKLGRHGIHYKSELEFYDEQELRAFNDLIDRKDNDHLDIGLGF